MAGSLPWQTDELQMQAADVVVRVSRTFDAPRQEVFAAWTEQELLTQWFRPAGGVSTAELDVRPGGKYRITMDPQGSLPGPAYIVGTYLKVEPPERLVFTFGWELPPADELASFEDLGDTEEFKDRVEDLARLDSLVTVQFLERDGATEVTITHERIRAPNLRAFHIFGWKMVLEQLAACL
jgi:uncharacterized protein YndB with AHSA1/START domain